MPQGKVKFSVFTKPWPALPMERLAEKIRALGFDGIEFPLRDGFQAEPRDAERGLKELSRRMAECGLEIYSVAAAAEERVFAACADNGVPMIRIMLDYDPEAGFRSSERSLVQSLERLQPLCETYGVRIGIQPHVGKTRVKSAAGLLRILERLPQEHFRAVWDAAHDGLRGEGPELGLDALWPYLSMVNLKNAYFRNAGEGDDGRPRWEPYFTTGRDGMASWPAVASVLKKRNYAGVVCLTAEYTDESQVDRCIAEDIAYAKSLLGEASS